MNEELLKYVEVNASKNEKEGQRCQTRKVHAEEKLKLLNEEITQVWSKAQAEALAVHVSLRREKMGIQVLEKKH